MSYKYDYLGDVTGLTDAFGHTLTYAYNAAAQLTTVTTTLSDKTHPGTLLSAAEYNSFGNRVSAALGDPDASATGILKNVHYDNRGRLTETETDSITRPTWGQFEHIWDRVGSVPGERRRKLLRGHNVIQRGKFSASDFLESWIRPSRRRMESIMSLTLARKGISSSRRWDVALFIVNVLGAITYLIAASRVWAIPEEHGQVPISGEPFVWFFSVVPIFIVFFFANLSWGAYICFKKRWRSGYIWLMVVAVWLIAIWIDFAHH
jgi:YD repeat-containing protein